MTAHSINVFHDQQTDGYWPECLCGWSGEVSHTESAALAAGDDHLLTVAVPQADESMFTDVPQKEESWTS